MDAESIEVAAVMHPRPSYEINDKAFSSTLSVYLTTLGSLGLERQLDVHVVDGRLLLRVQ